MNLIKATLDFEPRDCWIGFFWKSGRTFTSIFSGRTSFNYERDNLVLYVCLIPCLPIVLHFESDSRFHGMTTRGDDEHNTETATGS